MAMLSLSTVRSGHDFLALPVIYLVLGLDVLGVLCIRHMGDLEYGMDLLPFIGAVLLGILLQNRLAGDYYRGRTAFGSFVLLFAMVVCVILLTQKGYAAYIWKAINGASLFCASCIIAQMAAKTVGLRLDKMGAVSELFFNAWEFSRAYRPCGPFLEPAMYAQLGLISLFYYLFLKRSWWKAAYTALAVFLSTSALGLVGIVLLAAAFLVNLDKLCGVSRRRKYTVLALSAGAALLVFWGLLRGDVYVLQRALSGSSLDVRFLRSVDLYGLMSPVEKIIGIGLQNQQRYLNYHGIILAHDTYETISTNREFAGVLGYLCCTTGIIGLISFLFPFYRVFVRRGVRSKVMTILFAYSCLFCGMLTHSIFVLYIMAVYATVDLERSMEEA